MEGKEYYDDDKNRNEEEDSEDFGLPEVSYDSDEDDDAVASSGGDIYQGPPNGGGDDGSSGDSGGGGNKALWIIVILLLVAAAAFVAYWYGFRDRSPKPDPVPQEDTTSVEPDTVVYKEPEPEPEPKPIEMKEVNASTGKYYVIINSFIDDDLARDYGEKLKKQGQRSMLLLPKGNRKFYRVAIDSYVSLSEADQRAQELKSEYGDDVWVMRY